VAHRGAALAAKSAGRTVEVRIFDGDTGELCYVLGPGML
jgi:hypothetical protein